MLVICSVLSLQMGRTLEVNFNYVICLRNVGKLCLSGNVQGHVRQENIDFGGRQIFYLPLFLSSEWHAHWRFYVLSNLSLCVKTGNI